MGQLDELILSLPKLSEILKSVQDREMPFTLIRVSGEIRMHMLHHLHENTGRDILYITKNDLAAFRAKDDYPYRDVIYLDEPKPELRPVEAFDFETRQNRIRELYRIRDKGGVIFASVRTLLYKMREPSDVYSGEMILKKGDVISPKELAERFNQK